MQEVYLFALHLLKSRTEAIMRCTVTNHHLRGKGKRNNVQRRTKVSFGRTMMQVLELLRGTHISRRSNVEQ